MFRKFVDRMALWAWISLALAALIAWLVPHQLLVSVYKLSLITMAAWVAFWLDRALFPYARPDRFLEQPYSLGAPLLPPRVVKRGQERAFAAAMLRRAVIVAAAMVAVALGA